MLAMSNQAEPEPDFIKSITFWDYHREISGPPIHITSLILIDGEPHEHLLFRGEPWSIIGSIDEVTLVSFCVPEDRAEIGEFDADGNWLRGFTIDGHPALVPKGVQWEELERMGGDLIRVTIEVPEVNVWPRDAIPDLVVSEHYSQVLPNDQQ
jgi:hypothetical protein